MRKAQFDLLTSQLAKVHETTRATIPQENKDPKAPSLSWNLKAMGYESLELRCVLVQYLIQTPETYNLQIFDPALKYVRSRSDSRWHKGSLEQPTIKSFSIGDFEDSKFPLLRLYQKIRLFTVRTLESRKGSLES
jgi:hypothetical protein